MCLTIPKKVLRKKGTGYVVEKDNGEKQEVRSIIKIKAGDFVVTQSNVIIQKLSKKQAQEINDLLKQ
jgi:hydrogenase maturation factor